MSTNTSFPVRKSLDMTREMRARLQRVEDDYEAKNRAKLPGTAIVREALEYVLSHPNVLRDVVKAAAAKQ